MFELKLLSMSAIPAALAQAERYRLINEPVEAESICLDVLEIEPGNQDALITLLLARADQFDTGMKVETGFRPCGKAPNLKRGLSWPTEFKAP